jgi:hypothetical protein
VNNLSAGELISLVALCVFFVGVAPFFTWRRGGSTARIAVALLVSLIPAGFIVGMVIALTARRSRPKPSATTGLPPAQADPAVVPAHQSRRSRLVTGAVVVLILAAIASGVAGYYLGRQDTPTAQPTWVDREIRSTGTQNIGTLRCTYHLADGSVRVRESVIALSTTPPSIIFGTPNPLGARTPDCPPAP